MLAQLSRTPERKNSCSQGSAQPKPPKLSRSANSILKARLTPMTPPSVLFTIPVTASQSPNVNVDGSLGQPLLPGRMRLHEYAPMGLPAPRPCHVTRMQFTGRSHADEKV